MICDLGSRFMLEVLRWHPKVELIRAGDNCIERRRFGAKSEWCDDLHAVQKCYRSEESLYFNLLSINCEVILYCFSINSSPILMFCFYSIKFASLREVV